MTIIYFFENVFHEKNMLSEKANSIVASALLSRNTDIRLSIPSVVFIELFDKWLTTEEFVKQFHYEIFYPITQSPNIEVKPIEREVIENLICIGGTLQNHDLHDKIVLASAMMLSCPLITTDPELISFVYLNKVIPGIIN